MNPEPLQLRRHLRLAVRRCVRHPVRGRHTDDCSYARQSLGWAKAAYDSPAGRIVSGWRYDGDAVTYEFEIPANLAADVTLPDGRKFTLAPGKHTV